MKMTRDQQKTVGTHAALEASYKFFVEQQSEIGVISNCSHPYNPFDSNSADEFIAQSTPRSHTEEADPIVDVPMLPLIVTADAIQDWHRIALPSASSHEFRTYQEVFTTRSFGELFFYMQPALVPAFMSHFFDKWFLTSQHLATLSPTDLCPALIKFAAWVLGRFLYIHPFTNGNGRMGRLLVQFILNYICPFPVPITWSRQAYLRCIEHCQPRDTNLQIDVKSPSALAHLILRSVWRSWENWNQAVVNRGAASIIQVIPIVRQPLLSLDKLRRKLTGLRCICSNATTDTAFSDVVLQQVVDAAVGDQVILCPHFVCRIEH
jgi:hypothetical protein